MLGNNTSERQKAIINLISRIQENYAELGDYKSHSENSIGAQIELTNGKIFIPHIAIADTEFAFEIPDFIAHLRGSFVPFNTYTYTPHKQPFWKKIYNVIKINDKSTGKYILE
ncbi:hypothetical protein [Sporocytophaga myxococcoides]|uniref:hypothetical protein n=1 Tax=Sporocytophaga myxococcoides TaxID=153721 RepID=UPI00040BFE21|nr:hypothetical protein [Sporocytophaga myxococcoides]